MGFIREAVRRCSPNWEFLSGKGTLYRQSYNAPAAGGNTGILGATTQPTSGTTVVTTGITNPGVARCVRVVGNQATCTGNLVVAGKNQFGESITDTLAINGTTPVNGVKAFKTISSITVPTRGAASDSITVGPDVKLGLDRRISDAGAACLVASVDGTREGTLPTLNSTNHTVAFNTAPNGSRVFVMYMVHEDISNG